MIILKCIWCSKELVDNDSNVCSVECENKYNAFKEKINKNKYKFLLPFPIYMIIFLILIVIEGNSSPNKFPVWAMFWLSFGVGIILTVFPYATPKTNKAIGMQKSIFLCRLFRILAIILALFILVFYFVLV